MSAVMAGLIGIVRRSASTRSWGMRNQAGGGGVRVGVRIRGPHAGVGRDARELDGIHTRQKTKVVAAELCFF